LCPDVPARRVRATAAIVLFAAGWFSVVGHDAAVTHVRCALHGELLEVDACDARPCAAVSGEAGVHLVSRGHEQRDGYDAHAVCTLCLARSERTTMLESTAARALDVRLAMPVAPPQFRARPPAFPLFRLAPKQSPPALTA
jgi:hypothetical protein